MVELNSQFIFIIINILILYWILKKILFKPVTEFMENRKQGIKDSIAQAENKLKEAEQVKEKYQEMIKSAHTKADDILKSSSERAQSEYNKIIEQAKADAQKIIQKANENIELEKHKVMNKMRSEITNLAFTAASKIMQENMETDRNKKIIDDFLDKEGVA